MAWESGLPHYPIVSSTESYLRQNAYTVDICSLLLTFLHNTFYVRDARTARREQQRGRCECPPSILDNSAEKHFQYTYVFLEDSWQGINYTSSSGKNLPLDQSYKFHNSRNDTASYLYQTDGIYRSNILQTMCHILHKSAGHAGFFHSWCTALPLLGSDLADDLHWCHDTAGKYKACHNKVPWGDSLGHSARSPAALAPGCGRHLPSPPSPPPPLTIHRTFPQLGSHASETQGRPDTPPPRRGGHRALWRLLTWSGAAGCPVPDGRGGSGLRR